MRTSTRAVPSGGVQLEVTSICCSESLFATAASRPFAVADHVALASSGDPQSAGFRVSALTSEVDAANGLVFWTGRVTNRRRPRWTRRA